MSTAKVSIGVLQSPTRVAEVAHLALKYLEVACTVKLTVGPNCNWRPKGFLPILYFSISPRGRSRQSCCLGGVTIRFPRSMKYVQLQRRKVTLQIILG